MYEYNRVLGNEYYQPMVDYVLCKENQGVYHDYNIRHSTDLNEAGKEGLLTYPDLNDFLVKGYAKQIKERNQATANVHYHQLHGSLLNTEFSKDHLLAQHDRSGQARSRWLRELMVAAKEEDRLEMERMRREREAKELLDLKLAREEEQKRMQDPEVVAFLRGGAQAATMWCHRTPLTKEQRRARLEGKQDWEMEVDEESNVILKTAY